MVRRALDAVGISLASIAYAIGIRRSITLDNLRQAYPELSEREIRKIGFGAYLNLGRVFLEFPYLRFATRRASSDGIRFENPDVLQEATSKGKGVVIVSGHLANWEWLGHGLGFLFGGPVSVIVKNQATAKADRFMNRMRSRFGNRTINAGDVRAIYKTLTEGKALALLGDQSAPAESTRVPFFGRTVSTFEGPARLALHAGSALVFADCKRSNRGDYEVTFIPVPFDDLTETSPESVRELTARHTALLEAAIRKAPDQWLWQHRRWKSVDP